MGVKFIFNMMKIILLLVGTLSAPLLFADSSSCYSINDSDKKNYCLGISKNDASYCYSIREEDLKNLCLGQAKHDKSYCYSIRSSDTKNLCLGLMK